MRKRPNQIQSNLPRLTDSPSFENKSVNFSQFHKSKVSVSHVDGSANRYPEQKLSQELTLESIMASSPEHYFYALGKSDKKQKPNQFFAKAERSTKFNQTASKLNQTGSNRFEEDQKPNRFFEKDDRKTKINQTVSHLLKEERKSSRFYRNEEQNNGKNFNQTMRESMLLREKNKVEFSSIENLEFLKKIYKPRQESKEKFNDIKSAIMRNRIFKQFENGSNPGSQESNLKKKGASFRIREKHSAQLTSEESLQNFSNVGELISNKKQELNLKKEEYKDQEKENPIKKKGEGEENEKIKQNSTYKMIENKTLEMLNKKENNIQTIPSPEEQNEKISQENNNIQNNENKVKISNQPNSFNISVNLKPTFHLSLNSAMQNESLKQILESLQIKSNDIQISHPGIVNLQTNYEENEKENEKTIQKQNSYTFKNIELEKNIEKTNFKINEEEHKEGNNTSSSSSEIVLQHINSVKDKSQMKISMEDKNPTQTSRKSSNEKKAEEEEKICQTKSSKEKIEKKPSNETIISNQEKKSIINNKNDSQHHQLEKQPSIEIQIKSAPKKLQESGFTRDKIKKAHFDFNPIEEIPLPNPPTFELHRSRSKSEKPSSDHQREISDSLDHVDYVEENSASASSSDSEKVSDGIRKIKTESKLQQITYTPSIPAIFDLIPSKEENKQQDTIKENEEVVLKSAMLLGSGKNKRPNSYRQHLKRASQSSSFEIVRSFNKSQSEEEKEVLNMKLNTTDLSEFKSHFSKFSNNLKIPFKKRENTAFILEKKENIKSNNEIKLFQENFVKKSQIYTSKINFSFQNKNPIYSTKLIQLTGRNRHRSSVDRNYLTKKNSLFVTRFEENASKFFEKLAKFYDYHQNPFFLEDEHQLSLASSKIFSSKPSYQQENGMINLSEIFSNKMPSFHSGSNLGNRNDSPSLEGEALNSSNSFEDDDSIYNFTSKKSNERYTIRINPPDINNAEGDAEAGNHSFYNSPSPSFFKPKNKVEKIERWVSFKRKIFQSEEIQKRKLLSGIKKVFQEMDKKCQKVFEVYNYKKTWKLFKLLIFTNLQIFLSGNYYEIYSSHSREIMAVEGELKLTNMAHKNSYSTIRSYALTCPIYVYLDKNQECCTYKNSNGKPLIFFENKFEKIEESKKNDEKDESDLKKSVYKTPEAEEEGDSPMCNWENVSKLSLMMEDDFLINSNRLNDSGNSLENDDDYYENEKFSMRLKNGQKVEQFNVSFKSLGILIKYLNENILPYMTSLDEESNNSIQQHLPLVQNLDINSYMDEHEFYMNALVNKNHFIEKSVRGSKLMKMAIKFNHLNHELISKGGFEDFIEIPEKLRIFTEGNKTFDPFEEDIIYEEDLETLHPEKLHAGSQKSMKVEKETPVNDCKSLNNIDPVSRSLRNINELKSPITPTTIKDNSQTCPKVIEKKFFSSNEEIDILKPEIKILQTEKQETPDTVNSLKNTNFLQTPLETKDKPHKPMLRTQRKSLSGLFPQSVMGSNFPIKKIATGVLKSPTPNNNFQELSETNRNDNEVEIIQRNKTINEITDMPPSQFYSTRSLFGKSRKTVLGIRKNTKFSHEDFVENPYKEDDFIKSNKFLQGIRKIDESEIPFSKMSSNNLLGSGRLIMGKNSMSEIILAKDQMNLAKNLNMKKNNVSISDRDHLASPPNNTPNGRRNSNRIRMSIKKGEFKNMMDKSAISNEDSRKHLYNIAEIEIAADKMERGSIFVKTQMIYENQRKYMSIFQEMKWAVIHGKLLDLQHLMSKYSFEYIDQQDEQGNTLLMYAVINGDIEIVNFLVSKAVNCDIQNNDGDTALHLGIEHGNNEVTDLLVSLGVNQNLKNYQGKTAWDLTKKDQQCISNKHLNSKNELFMLIVDALGKNDK